MYNILTIGTGYVGRAVADYYVFKKQKVFGTLRNSERVSEFEAAGINPIVCDFLNPETLLNIPKAHFVLIAVAPDERNEQSYEDVYLKGVANTLAALRKHPKPLLVVYISSTGVYGDMGGACINEETMAQPRSEREKILLAAERQVFSSGYPTVVLRLSGIYGPGRNRIQTMKRGAWEVPEKDSYLNVIHRDDIVGMMPYLFKDAQEGQIYLGTDDQPCKRSDLYNWLASQLQHEERMQTTLDAESGKRCSNSKLRKLGWAPKYPSFKEGYESLLSQEASL